MIYLTHFLAFAAGLLIASVADGSVVPFVAFGLGGLVMTTVCLIGKYLWPPQER